MQAAIKILKEKYKLPIDELVSAETGEHYTSILKVMQEVCEYELTDQQFNDAIREIVGDATLPNETVRYMPKYVFRYLVQNLTVNYKDPTVGETIGAIYTKSIAQAAKYIRENPWTFATGEDENAPPKLDSNGNIQPKKGDKKEMAKAVWLNNQENPTLWKVENGTRLPIRKLWIELLVKEVGLTEGGASTYFQNLKTGVY